MDSTRTMIREHRRCPEYSEIFPTRLVDETGQFGDRTQRGSTQVRWFGQDLYPAPDSGIGYSQDHRTQWANGDWVEQASYHPTGSQLMGRKHRAGDRLYPRQIGRRPSATVRRPYGDRTATRKCTRSPAKREHNVRKSLKKIQI